MWIVAKESLNGKEYNPSEHIIAACSTRQDAIELAGKINNYYEEVKKPAHFIVGEYTENI